MHRLKSAVTVLAATLAAFAPVACQKSGLRKQTRFLMDTYVRIQAVGPAAQADSAIDAAFNRMEEIDIRFNFLDTLSPLHRFNSAGEPVEDDDIRGLLGTALDVGRRSGGAFDVTIQPLLELWGFYGEDPSLPDSGDIAGELARVGMDKLELAKGRMTALEPGVSIDLGGIAKGYGLSEAARVLREFGIDSALIDAGGDVYALGKHKGENWGIGVRDPRGGDGLMGVIEASDLAVVTSGDYERFFTVGGTRYSHILDPRTGHPARGLISVTVISRDPTLADAWATALFVLGPEGIVLAEEVPDIEALLVTDSLEVFATRQLMALAEEASEIQQ